MKGILYLLTVVFFISCNDERSKEKHYGTIKMCNDLYIETFVIFGSGAFGGDVHSNYLTDSINFRIYIGKEDTGREFITMKCNSDSLFVEKYVNDLNDSAKLSERKYYSLNLLRKEKKFE